MEQSTTTDRPTDASANQPQVPAVPASSSTPTPPDKKGTTFESLAIAGFVFGIFAMVVAVFAVGLAARAVSDSSGGGGGAATSGGSAPAALDVTLADFSLDPNVAEIAAGGKITLKNTGAVAHDLVVEGAKSAMVEPGADGELVVDGVAPGKYTMYCSVPGHREAGMEGTITVK